MYKEGEINTEKIECEEQVEREFTTADGVTASHVERDLGSFHRQPSFEGNHWAPVSVP